MEPFAVDGRVDLEQLQSLLAAQGEYPALDYKESCDPGDTEGGGRAEFVKDCAAMLTRPDGGYLVIGVDGRGTPIGATLDSSMFDSASLRSILTKYLEGDIPVASQVHALDGGDVAVIFLGRRDDHLFPIVKADVTFKDSRGNTKTPLRAGDVIVRDGTSSRRWRTTDLLPLLKPLIDSVRREEQARVGDLVAQLAQQQQGTTIARGALTNITWRLPEDAFTNAITELSRIEDTRGLRVVMMTMASEGRRLANTVDVESDDFADLLTVLDRLITCVGVGLLTGDFDLINHGVGALHAVYVSVGFDGTPPNNNAVPLLWFEIATRVLAAMALAVRLDEWPAVRTLALRPVGQNYVYRSWLRHADVWAGRTGQAARYVDGDHPGVLGLLVAVARQKVASVAALRPDVPGADAPPPVGTPPADQDVLLDSVCQADFLWCVVAAAGGRGPSEQYPSFAALYDHRTMPVVDRLKDDEQMQNALLPGCPREEVHAVVQLVLQSAANQGHFWF
ncbi:AlbA family DNA-binding domain-containing protein [Phycicoccus avicenniae]|uniref:AlbA family DNA-binding domain-containing protein n=1 Tax=Phycicoccus avicenniae TaxID=2828860 RepID=UPI003D2CABE9